MSMSTESEHGNKEYSSSSLSKDSQDLEKQSKRKSMKPMPSLPHLVGTDNEMAGYLQKRRGGFGRHMPNAWQIRYFTLRDGIMYYYEDSGADMRPRGKIDLKSENCDFMNGIVFEGAPTPYTMQIIPGGWDEKWKLCATTKDEMDQWVTAIMKHITDETKRKPTSIAIKSYMSDEEEDDGEAEEDDGPHLKMRGIPVSGGNSVVMAQSSPVAVSPPGTATAAGGAGTVTPTSTESRSRSETLNSIPPIATINSATPTPGAVVSIDSPSAPSSTLPPTVSPPLSTAPPAPPPSSSASASSLPSSQPTKAKSKRRLKLQSEAGGESDEMESITVLVLVNLCLLFAHTTSHLTLTILYYLILNAVLIRTLQLRSARLFQQHQSLTTAHHTAVKLLQEQHHQAVQALIQKAKESSQAAGGSLLPATATDLLALDPLASEEETTMGGEEAKQSGPPVPGTTMVQVINGVPPDVPTHTWNLCDPSAFNVRVGPDYSKYKRKGPSAKALYEPYAVDTFCAKNRIDNVASHIKLENTDHIDTHNEFVPPLLMVQIQLPSEAPPLFGTIEDGPGWAIVMYFRITQETCDELKNLATASPAVKLFAKYCQYAEKDPAWRGRFKVINFCSNLEEMGVPSVIMSYNAKPVLIRRTGSVFRGVGSSRYLEIDIHVHKFANLAKKSIHALSSRCGLMYMQIGFVIEGRTDEELPETLFACVGVNRPEEDKAEFLLDPQDDEA